MVSANYLDWPGFPKDSGLTRLDSWFYEHINADRKNSTTSGVYHISADGDRTFEVADNDGNSSTEFVVTGGPALWVYGTTRVSQFNGTEYIWFEDDGTTAILTLDRDATTTTAIFAKTVDVDRVTSGDGSLSAPSYSFTSDTNTGMYWVSADWVNVVAGGSARVMVEPTHTRIRGGNNSGSGAGGRIYLETENGTDIVSFDWNASGQTRMIVPSGRFDVVEDGGGTLDFRFANLGTTANAANAYVTSASGQLNRSTSLRKYKWDIQDYQGPDIDALQPRRFKWQPDVAGYQEREWSYGFIVEEAFEADPAFTNLEDGKPTDLDLRAILAAVTAKVQEHDRILNGERHIHSGETPERSGSTSPSVPSKGGSWFDRIRRGD